LRDYLHVVRRRKWIILQAVVLVPAAAIAFSLHQQKLYQAQAKVLLSTQNLAAQLTGTQNTGVSEPQTEVVQTQAEVARVPAIAARVLGRIPRSGLTVNSFLTRSSVSASTTADILSFGVTNHDPALAKRLVDEYASSYAVYRRKLDTAAIHNALVNVDGRIQSLVAAGGKHGSLYTSLVQRQQTLATMSALQTSNAQVVQYASKPVLTQPKTSRNAILGLFLGIVLGIGLAFLWEALDTRVRSAQEIGDRLGLPMLGRIPAPRKALRDNHRLVMLGDPTATEAEAFRMLRTSLEFATLGRDIRTIMITSAVEQEGKSTTIANLAIALARAGQKVILVDLDLRRPYLDRFFNLQGPGLTQVALGRATLEQALSFGAVSLSVRPQRETQVTGNGHVRVSSVNLVGNGNGNGNGNGHGLGGSVKGVLAVIPSGPMPPDPGEFVGTAALSELLAELRELADIVLVDAPPVLHVGDAMTLSAKVDGIIVATKMKVVRRNMLGELNRQLAGSPTPVLGYVVTGAQEEDAGYGYGYGYGYTPRPYERREQAEPVRSDA
jgi:Mrp family chromosome partitioning ATPase